MARLARLLARKAIGLVFAGGGARGFAHLGIWRALQEHGIEIDCVGGTSIGAVLASLVAADPPVEKAIGIARKAFSTNPTGDFNWLPLISLIKGRRVRAAIERSIGELVGAQIAIEDLWKTYFCVATNYSQAREQAVRSGDLARALLASIAIPGALPPVVHDGDLLCDGGTFNNFPVDLMRDMRGVGTVIGVDLGARNPRRLDFDEVPGTWALLRDRLRTRSKRRYRLPSLMAYLLNVTILYSTSRQQQLRQLTDLYFSPPLYRVGLLQWSRFDRIVAQGHDHAIEVLGGLSDRAAHDARHDDLTLRHRIAAAASRLAQTRTTLPGFKNIERIERSLDARHQFQRVVAVFLAQKLHLVHAHTVLAGAGAVHRQSARNDALVQPLGFGQFLGFRRVGQNRAVEVAIADMAEDRRRQERLLRVANRFGNALGQP